MRQISAKLKLIILIMIMVTCHIWATTSEEKCKEFIKSQGFGKEISSVSLVQQDVNGAFYLVTFKNSGFVLVASSTDDQFATVGYSDNSNFDLSKDNPIGKALFKSEPAMFNQKSLKKVAADEEIPPLGTALFNQNTGWNALCPMDGGSRTMVGCVGTAMAIIMQYWNYPYYAKGSSTYIHETIKDISVNFDNYWYRWDLMSKNTSDTYNTALLYHCAAATKTTFGVDLSSMVNNNNITYALKSNFGYSNNLHVIWKDQVTREQWSALIKEQLKMGKPVLYLGGDQENGHAFVVEGYQNGKFYINWGWSGNSNGYFDIGFLYSPPIDYRTKNYAFFDMEPQKIYPPRDIAGSLQNGSIKLNWTPPSESALLKHFVLPYRDVARSNTKGPQRMTSFNPADFGFSAPVTLDAVGHSFYLANDYSGDSSFKYVIYKGGSSEILYQSSKQKAVVNSEIYHKLSSSITINDSFYVAVAPSGSDSIPPSYASMVEKDVCHSQYGDAGSWTKFNYAAPGGRELHTYVYVTGTRSKGNFPKGGYIVTRNGIPLDTIQSLEECIYIDNAPLKGKNVYRVVSFKDTTSFVSVASDSVAVQNGSVSIVGKQGRPLLMAEKNALFIRLDAKVKVLVEEFAIDGRKIGVVKDGYMDAGAHVIPLCNIYENHIGYYLLRLKIGENYFYLSKLSKIR
jgi:hypothetical protein